MEIKMEIKEDLEAIKEHFEDCIEELRELYGDFLKDCASDEDIKNCRRLHAILKKMERMA